MDQELIAKLAHLQRFFNALPAAFAEFKANEPKIKQVVHNVQTAADDIEQAGVAVFEHVTDSVQLICQVAQAVLSKTFNVAGDGRALMNRDVDEMFKMVAAKMAQEAQP